VSTRSAPSRPPRIAVVTPILPVPQDMTRGRFIYETTRALSRMTPTRVFLTQAAYPKLPVLRPAAHPAPRVEAGHTLPGIDIEAVTYPALPLLSRLSNGWMAGRSLVEPIRQFSPDILIGYWVYPEGAGAQYAARKLGKPMVLGALGTDINDRSGLTERLTRNTLQMADATIFVSEAMSRFAQSHYGVSPSRCHTIVNGYNTSVFHPQDRHHCRDALDLPASARVIVYVGRLIEAKGLRELIEAVDRLRQADSNVLLVIIGNGEFRNPLESMVQERKLGAHVRFAGGLLPEVVAKYLNAADLLTLPSWSEGYPNVLVEALACGCPVVASDVGGIPEIVDADRGLLTLPKDVPSLHDGLRAALDAPWSRSGIAASMRRTWDDVARETLDVCQSLIA